MNTERQQQCWHGQKFTHECSNNWSHFLCESDQWLHICRPLGNWFVQFKVLYTVWFPLLLPSILTCYQFGEKKDTFLGVAEVVSNIKFSINLFARGFHLSLYNSTSSYISICGHFGSLIEEMLTTINCIQILNATKPSKMNVCSFLFDFRQWGQCAWSERWHSWR